MGNRMCFFLLVCLSWISVGATAESPAPAEVHAIGLYEGRLADPKGYRRALQREVDRCRDDPGGRCWSKSWPKIRRAFKRSATVFVDHPGLPVTLVLTAYEPTLWKIRVAPGSTIERVILSGYHRQRVERSKDLRDTAVESLWPREPVYFYEDDTLERYIPEGGEGCSDNPQLRVDSSLQNFLDVLAARGLTVDSLQAPREKGKFQFSVTAETKGNLLRRIPRDPGYCYREPDGSLTLVPYDWPSPHGAG